PAPRRGVRRLPVRGRRAERTGADLEEGERARRDRRVGPPVRETGGDVSVPTVYLARHGETEWSKAGRHTGRTDLPLTPQGGADARRLGERLRGTAFARVFSSPLARARRTAELAGFAPEVEPDLLEWDYGQYEGKTSAEIRAGDAGWLLFR